MNKYLDNGARDVWGQMSGRNGAVNERGINHANHDLLEWGTAQRIVWGTGAVRKQMGPSE